MFQQLRQQRQQQQQQQQQTISVDRTLVSSLFQPITTKRARDTKSESNSVTASKDDDSTREQPNKRLRLQDLTEPRESISPEKPEKPEKPENPKTEEETKNPMELSPKIKAVSATDTALVPTVADIPARPTQTSDAIAHFPKETQSALAKAISRVQSAETTFSVSCCGSFYELVVKHLQYPIRLSNIELMLGDIACNTKLFVWDTRLEFISGTLKLSFLPSRPLAGHLVRLPGVTLMQLDASRGGRQEPEDLECLSGYDHLKHFSKGRPFHRVFVHGSDLPEALNVDQSSQQMLMRMRDNLELMSGEFSPESARAEIVVIEGGFQVECIGHTQATLAELRRLVLPFPCHVVDVIIRRSQEPEPPGAVVAIKTRPYDKPAVPFFKPLESSGYAARMTHV